MIDSHYRVSPFNDCFKRMFSSLSAIFYRLARLTDAYPFERVSSRIFDSFSSNATLFLESYASVLDYLSSRLSVSRSFVYLAKLSLINNSYRLLRRRLSKTSFLQRSIRRPQRSSLSLCIAPLSLLLTASFSMISMIYFSDLTWLLRRPTCEDSLASSQSLTISLQCSQSLKATWF